ncbi:hypothetical protein B0H14DRAFT_2597997 [Mycena olivaceomarginata]|nr:hypothetical protein B0H14DRAFT_2597997 [Mycena olivaceomarginata]
MCLAWLEARKPESQSPGFASQAKPNSGLDGGFGFGLSVSDRFPAKSLPRMGKFEVELKLNTKTGRCQNIDGTQNIYIRVLVSLENCLEHPTTQKKMAVKPRLKPKPSQAKQALPAGLGSGLTDFKPKPAQAKPKPWFQSQVSPNIARCNFRYLSLTDFSTC